MFTRACVGSLVHNRKRTFAPAWGQPCALKNKRSCSTCRQLHALEGAGKPRACLPRCIFTARCWWSLLKEASSIGVAGIASTHAPCGVAVLSR